jgi:hypothetical protein
MSDIALKVKEGYRAGYFHRGSENPHQHGSTAWESWEIGRYFQKNGLGFFNITKVKPCTYRVENGEEVVILYGGKHQYTIGIQGRFA